MDKIKWGIVGPGHIANKFAQDLVYSELGELHGVASRDMKKAQRFAKTFNGKIAYGNYNDLYADENIDAIYIATPHNFHLQNATDALKAGKAVLCEKPLTVNPDECKNLITVANETGSYLMEGMWTYFLPAIRKALQWVTDGNIGNVVKVNSDFGFAQPDNPKGRHLNPDLAGGALLDMGIYNIAMAEMFIQKEITDMHVIADLATTGVDQDVTMLFRYDNALANLNTSFTCKTPNITYIIGEKGYISIPDFWMAGECHLHNSEGIIESFNDKRITNGFIYEIDSVCQDLLDGKTQSDIMPLSTSLKFQEVMKSVMERF